MLLEDIVRMLKTLINYKESEIVHTFSTPDHSPAIVVIYKSDINEFEVTYIKTQTVKNYTDINLLANEIEIFMNPIPVS